jgi:hypothetical protein
MIPLYVVNATGATLLSLDDPAVDQDQGADFTASFTTVAMTPQPSEGQSKLRRAVQNVAITTSATVKITPIVDGNENPDDTQTFSLTSIADGASPTLEARTANQGSRFQIRTEVTAHVGPCELGEAEQWTTGKFSTRVN